MAATTTDTIRVTVDPVNDAPVAGSDTSTVTQRLSVSENVLTNDTDADIGDTKTVSTIAFAGGGSVALVNGTASIAGAYGSLTINADGSYTYAADSEGLLKVGETRNETFSYTMRDGAGLTSSADLKVAVTGSSLGTEGANIFLLTGSGTSASGLGGSDTYVVDDASDRVIEAKNGDGIDVVQSSASYSLGGTYVEELTLTGSANLDGTGNSLNNIIRGNGGDNTLDGGRGADTMIGGVGSDTFIVDSAGDRLVELKGDAGTDVAQASVSYSLAGLYVENLTLTGTGNINGTGNSLANVITGNDGANILNGGTGADRLIGGVGSDTYVIDNAGDRVIELKDDAGIDLVQSTVSFSLGGTYAENLTLTGSSAINALGNSLDNTLIGNAANNRIDGLAGQDILTGGAGRDTFVFSTALRASNVDHITDFIALSPTTSATHDTIALSQAVFAALTAGTLADAAFKDISATSGGIVDRTDRILYDRDSGALFYDADGSGKTKAVQFATLDNKIVLTHDDFSIIG
nr:Ig-like domain-containing protein [Methylobacterium sp. Leaf85]